MSTLEASAPAPTETALELTRVIRAPRAKVYAAWTDAATLQKWFGPAERYCPSASLDARVGGSYFIDIQPLPEAAKTAAGGGASASGKYLKVIPNELLQFSWIPSFLPDEESVVTISLRDVDGGTELKLRHERFSAGSSAGYQKGWTGSLEKLAGLLEG